MLIFASYFSVIFSLELTSSNGIKCALNYTLRFVKWTFHFETREHFDLRIIYDSLENVTVIEKQYNKVVYSGKGYYCNSIDNSRIANKIDIRFIGKFCTGEYNNNKLVLNQTDKPNFEKTITETVDADYSKNIIFK